MIIDTDDITYKTGEKNIRNDINIDAIYVCAECIIVILEKKEQKRKILYLDGVRSFGNLMIYLNDNDVDNLDDIGFDTLNKIKCRTVLADSTLDIILDAIVNDFLR